MEQYTPDVPADDVLIKAMKSFEMEKRDPIRLGHIESQYLKQEQSTLQSQVSRHGESLPEAEYARRMRQKDQTR